MRRFIPKGYIDLLEAARILGIHHNSVRRLIKRGIISASLLYIAGWESKKWLIRKKDLKKFAAKYDPRPSRQVRKPWLRSGEVPQKALSARKRN